jgi:trans-aconitate 2-methyltransferase
LYLDVKILVEVTMAKWSPATYLQFADERSRPFFDLTTRVLPEAPRTVVDLGCGPGQLTATLAVRWPSAHIQGIDSSAEMIAHARELAGERLSFSIEDLTRWQPDQAVDVIVSNAALQWVPDHRALFARWVKSLAPGGWLAFQVPGNFNEPSHRLLHDLTADSRFAEATKDVEAPSAYDAAVYLRDLAALGCTVEAWETTYLHVLTGVDPVFAWIAGTGARPILQALPAEQRAAFEQDYKSLLRRAYPASEFGTILPYRRVFVVARRGSGNGPRS